jgi:hypothetical protein
VSNAIFYLAVTTNACKPCRQNDTPIWEVTDTPLYTFSYELSLLRTHTRTHGKIAPVPMQIHHKKTVQKMSLCNFRNSTLPPKTQTRVTKTLRVPT